MTTTEYRVVIPAHCHVPAMCIATFTIEAGGLAAAWTFSKMLRDGSGNGHDPLEIHTVVITTNTISTIQV